MPSYLIKSFNGGQADYEDKGIPGSFQFGSNLNIRKENRDTLTCKQALIEEGLVAGSHSPSASVSPSVSVSTSPSLSPSHSASPTPSPSASQSPSASASLSPSSTKSSSPSISSSVSQALTSVFRGLIHWFVKATDGYTYGFDNKGYVYRRDSSGFWLRVNKVSGAILGAAEWYSSTGKTYLFLATANVLYKKELPGRTDWNDITIVGQDLSTAATWHTMRECGGALMIANAGTLAMVGYDQSYTNDALDLIPGNIATTIVERNGRTVVGTARAANLTGGINAAIDAEYPLAQVGTDGQLVYVDMVNSVAAKRFPGGGKVNPGGVTNEIDQVNFFEWEQTALSWIDKKAVGNMSLWGVFNADAGKNGVYSYGRYNKNKPFVLNLDYELDVDEIGAITVVDNGTLLISYRDGSSYGVKAVDPNSKAVGTYVAPDFRAPSKLPADITNYKYAEIFCEALPTGTSIEYWYKIDKTGSWLRAETADGDTNFDTANAQRALFFINADCKVFSHMLVLKPYGNTCPEIHWVETYFE